VNVNNFNEKVSFIWSVADLLRGPYRPNQYKDVMLPLTVLRRLDCVLEPTKEKVLEKQKSLEDSKFKDAEPILNRVAGQSFHNTSPFTFEKLKGDPDKIAANLTQYIQSSVRLTCIQIRCQTSRWDISSRSSSGDLMKPVTRRLATTSLRGRLSG